MTCEYCRLVETGLFDITITCPWTCSNCKHESQIVGETAMYIGVMFEKKNYVHEFVLRNHQTCLICFRTFKVIYIQCSNLSRAKASRKHSHREDLDEDDENLASSPLPDKIDPGR